ncbi:MAG: RNA helicase [Actinobacteria bacterium]|mgnify:FL=1|nr:MAG: RNA helicase [Actinomycetota bacterium]
MSRLSPFWDGLALVPDDFQLEAGRAIADGHSVVVTAPTGSGKTLVADAAIYLALLEGKRVFYTTPIKALSNQKYGDLVAAHGPERVGLLTGDNVINGDAEIVVMTTEVLRNMIYADASRLARVSHVILDEVHYLQDRMRGAVWEEVIIHCPKSVQLVCLSATISNNAEFAAWVGERRGSTRLISTEHRPVPLESLYMIKDKAGSRALHLLPTFTTRDGRRRPNSRIEHMLGLERGRKRRFKTPNRIETVERLAEEKMLPAIYFIFSRVGCDTAARRLADAGVKLTDTEERNLIVEIAETRTAHLEDQDLKVLGYDEWVFALEQGIGSHHAGLVPAFKETVEELFSSGLLKVVFATETLALGINMPARTVVIENLSRYNGETHELLRPGDYTQLTGRAGRRGIDVEGFGVVLHSPYVRFSNVTDIAALGSHPLSSSFRPTYNMTANLVAKYERERAEELLASSFAAYQREEERHTAARTIEALESEYAKELAIADCELGSIDEYLAVMESSQPSPHNDNIASGLGEGVVVDVSGGARDGRYVVLKRLSRKNGARYLVLSTSGRVSTLGYKEIVAGSTIAGSLDLPRPIRPRDRRFIQDSLKLLRKLPSQPRNRSSRPAEVSHPVAACPDASRHLAAARKARRLERKLEQYRTARRASGHGLVEEFHSITGLLEDMRYMSGWSLTQRGERLRGVYNESDLLLTECLEQGYFYALAPAELAALLSVFVFEPRTDQPSVAEMPTDTLVERWSRVEEAWSSLIERERVARLSPTRRPDPGFAAQAYKWVSGEDFDSVSSGAMAPGDFVRVSRQLVDLLRQIRDVAPDMAEECRDALKALDRGVVAAQGVG